MKKTIKTFSSKSLLELSATINSFVVINNSIDIIKYDFNILNDEIIFILTYKEKVN